MSCWPPPALSVTLKWLLCSAEMIHQPVCANWFLCSSNPLLLQSRPQRERTVVTQLSERNAQSMQLQYVLQPANELCSQDLILRGTPFSVLWTVCCHDLHRTLKRNVLKAVLDYKCFVTGVVELKVVCECSYKQRNCTGISYKYIGGL